MYSTKGKFSHKTNWKTIQVVTDDETITYELDSTGRVPIFGRQKPLSNAKKLQSIKKKQTENEQENAKEEENNKILDLMSEFKDELSSNDDSFDNFQFIDIEMNDLI